MMLAVHLLVTVAVSCHILLSLTLLFTVSGASYSLGAAMPCLMAQQVRAHKQGHGLWQC